MTILRRSQKGKPMKDDVGRIIEAEIDRHSGDIYSLCEFGHPRDAIKVAADEVLKAIEDAGLVIVPREPTEAMLEAGDGSDSEGGYETYARGIYDTNARRIYTAMIEAATIGE